MKEKEKEVKALTQVVETRSKIISEQTELTKLHQSLLEQTQNASTESLQIKAQKEDMTKIQEKMKNMTENMKLG